MRRRVFPDARKFLATLRKDFGGEIEVHRPERNAEKLFLTVRHSAKPDLTLELFFEHVGAARDVHVSTDGLTHYVIIKNFGALKSLYGGRPLLALLRSRSR